MGEEIATVSNGSSKDTVESEDDDEEDEDYYENSNFQLANDGFDSSTVDPEHLSFTCLDELQVQDLFTNSVEIVQRSLSLPAFAAKILLINCGWDAELVKRKYREEQTNFLKDCGISFSETKTLTNRDCHVCEDYIRHPSILLGLGCYHVFCTSCWSTYLEMQIANGISTKVQCMESGCSLICTKGFVRLILSNKPDEYGKYLKLSLEDCVLSHPHFIFCPNKCGIIVMAKSTKAKRATCSRCDTSFCILCGNNYHAPASCKTIRSWLTKCEDDSETANYISANTKNCPNCHSYIEKNGGCNHMQCAKCKHHFCWMCFGDWKTHKSEFYDCSRYKENPQIARERSNLDARLALDKYLHYYGRYENHNNSLNLEEEHKKGLKKKIDEKTSTGDGSWIDWQHLYKAASLLTRCRYTLKYTYPFAYYIDEGPRKMLFEFQQGQLEKEVEELSWKVERADSVKTGDLENQMYVAECKRRSLLRDFFD